MDPSASPESILARCHGYTVNAADRELGKVVTPVFSETLLQPHSLLVHPTGSPPDQTTVVRTAHITRIDAERHEITLGINARQALDPGSMREAQASV